MMKLKENLEILFKEDTIDTAIGDDNLLAIFRVDSDANGNYWEVSTKNTDTDEVYDCKRFRDENKAKEHFEKVKKEF